MAEDYKTISDAKDSGNSTFSKIGATAAGLLTAALIAATPADVDARGKGPECQPAQVTVQAGKSVVLDVSKYCTPGTPAKTAVPKGAVGVRKGQLGSAVNDAFKQKPAPSQAPAPASVPAPKKDDGLSDAVNKAFSQPSQAPKTTTPTPAPTQAPPQTSQPAETSTPSDYSGRVTLSGNLGLSPVMADNNFARIEGNSGNILFRVAGLLGHAQPASAGYDSKIWNLGLAGGLTAMLGQFGQLDFDAAYVYGDRNMIAIDPVDSNDNLVPDNKESRHAIGAILQYLVGKDAKYGLFRADIGHDLLASDKTQTLVGQPDVHNISNKPAPRVNGPVTVATEIDGKITTTLTRMYEGSRDEANTGLMIHYVSPAFWNALRLGAGMGAEWHKMDSEGRNQFFTDIDKDITTKVTVTRDGISDTDERRETDRETQDRLVNETPAHRRYETPLLDLMASFNSESFPWVRANGLLRVHLNPDKRDDADRVEGAASLLLPLKHIILSGNYAHADQSNFADFMVAGGKTDVKLIEQFYQAINQTLMGFQPDEVDAMNLQMAYSGLLDGLDGILLSGGFVGTSKKIYEGRAGAGWGADKFSVLASYHHPQKQLSADVMLKSGWLNGVSLLLSGSMPLGDGDRRQSDYRVSALVSFPFGRGGSK